MQSQNVQNAGTALSVATSFSFLRSYAIRTENVNAQCLADYLFWKSALQWTVSFWEKKLMKSGVPIFYPNYDAGTLFNFETKTHCS